MWTSGQICWKPKPVEMKGFDVYKEKFELGENTG